MLSDIKLENNKVNIEGDYLKFKGVDILLDNASRRGSRNRSKPRRALVHNPDDGLTINWANDYPGGVTINKVKVIDPILEGKVVAKGTITAEKGIIIKSPYGLEAKSATFTGRVSAKDITLSDLGFEGSNPMTLRPRKVAKVIKELEQKIKTLEAKVRRLENR